jgi:hypothetical protein
MFLCFNITNSLHEYGNTARMLICPSNLNFYANLSVLEVGGKIRVSEANFWNHIVSQGVREQISVDGSE